MAWVTPAVDATCAFCHRVLIMQPFRFALVWMIVALPWETVWSQATTVSIHLKNGSQFVGFPTEQTDPASLRLRVEGQRFAIEQAIPWDAIDRVMMDGLDVSIEELRSKVHQLASTYQPPNWLPREDLAGRMAGNDFSEPGLSHHRIADAQLSVSLMATGAEPDPDTLLLTIVLLDEQRNAVQATAGITIDLYAPVIHDFVAVPRGNGAVWEKVASWRATLQRQPPAALGRTLVLPLSALRIERRQLAGPFGYIRIRIVVPGQRVFERRLDWVPLKPIIPFEHQQR